MHRKEIKESWIIVIIIIIAIIQDVSIMCDMEARKVTC
jgi:hypothetical protein